MKSSLPIPPENNTLFKSNNQSIQPINSSLKKVDNIQAMKNNSAINTNQNMVMSHAPNTNPVQSALINQHQQGLPLQSQQIKPNQNIQNSSLIDQNSSIKNSIHNSQQQQLNRQSQQIKQSSAIQSQMKNSNIGNNMDQSNIKNSKDDDTKKVNENSVNNLENSIQFNMNNKVEHYLNALYKHNFAEECATGIPSNHLLNKEQSLYDELFSKKKKNFPYLKTDINFHKINNLKKKKKKWSREVVNNNDNNKNDKRFNY